MKKFPSSIKDQYIILSITGSLHMISSISENIKYHIWYRILHLYFFLFFFFVLFLDLFKKRCYWIYGVTKFLREITGTSDWFGFLLICIILKTSFKNLYNAHKHFWGIGCKLSGTCKTYVMILSEHCTPYLLVAEQVNNWIGDSILNNTTKVISH